MQHCKPVPPTSQLLEELIERGYYTGRIKSQALGEILGFLSRLFLSFDGYKNESKSSTETTFSLSGWSSRQKKAGRRSKLTYWILKILSILTRKIIIGILDNASCARIVIPQYFESRMSQASGTRLDAYMNEATAERIIPWHRDGAHAQEFAIADDNSFCTVKCFVFLPPSRHPEDAALRDSGSLSLIPSSHKIVRLVDRLYHEGKITGAKTMHSGSLRNWSLDEIKVCAEQAVTSGYCETKEINLINQFLSNIVVTHDNQAIPKNFSECSGRFFSYVVFDEKIIHMGRGSATSRRLVMRRFYMAKSKS